ncbi:MAG: DUF1565 domain-containing protein, partial [Myxococcaceae bacterium]|nr:DUF1565 domain-containing protein [Myxococcaceae bacterium]
DGGTIDGGTIDGGTIDGGIDAGVTGCVGLADNTPCGQNSLCKGQVCSACVDPTDDSACATAYGAPRLCLSGACAVANCRSDVNCASAGHPGWVCGLSVANQCAPCSIDTHCTNAPGYGASTMCALDAGTCISAACGNAATTQTTTSVSTACSAANPADFCCARAGGTSCAAGNCCSDPDCAAQDAGVCRSNTCTTCGAVTNNQYFVDPINGSDTNSTGSAICPFRSLGRAIQFINAGGAAPAGTQITLVNNSLNSNATRGEVFPVNVPANVIITGANVAGPRTIEIPSGKSGFSLTAANSGLGSLIIDGKAVGVTGVQVSGASSNVTTTLATVTIRNMGSNGVLVTAGGLRINPGCLFTANGQNIANSGQGAGLSVTGGNVTANIALGQAGVGFNANLGNGLLVNNSGSVTFTGVPDLTGYPLNQNPPAVSAGLGTLTINGNTLANVGISQSGATRPVSLLNGVVAWGGKGNGFNFSSGSAVNLRNSVAAKNEQSGVRITASFSGPITGAGSGPTINLGPDNLGKNVLQTPTNGNKGAGICIDGAFFNAVQSLSAKANYFSSKDCSAAATMPVTTVNSSLDGCTNGIDVGLERTSTNQQQTNIRVLLANCQDL